MLQRQQLPHCHFPLACPLGQLWWCAQAKFTNLQLKSLWQFFAMQSSTRRMRNANQSVRYVYASVTCVQGVCVWRVRACVCVCAQLIWCIVDFLAFSRQILIDILLCGAHQARGGRGNCGIQRWAGRSMWCVWVCVCASVRGVCRPTVNAMQKQFQLSN